MANVDTNDEPSMEDILASIRKIISDDDEGAASEAAANTDDSEVSADDLDAMFNDAATDSSEDMLAEEEEVLELTQDFEADTDVVFADPEPEEEEPLDLGSDDFAVEDDEPDMMAGDSFEEEMDMPALADTIETQVANSLTESLLSANAQKSVSGAFGDLAHTILSKNARTLEDLVKDMLKPMLKNWLDDNLPTMVERLVREEIERVTRGSR